MNIDEINKILTFKPLDIKALLASTYFTIEKDRYATIGKRKFSILSNPPKLNPGALDVLLRSLFMKKNIPFVINNNGRKVENVTVVGFRRKVEEVKKVTDTQRRSLRKKKGEVVAEIAKVATIALKMRFLQDLDFKSANGYTKSSLAKGEHIKTEEMKYLLYLNQNDEIIESDLVSGNVDFLWFADGKGDVENHTKTPIKYEDVSRLAEKSVSGGGTLERLSK
jgi:hypothetical protein